MDNRKTISVGELDRRLKRSVEAATGADWVLGEIAALKSAGSGHVYFTLRDEREDAAIDCVMYRAAAQRARRHLVDGQRVLVLGRATLWAPRGRLQYVAEVLQPAGRGALLEALERLKQRLQLEGLFASERKRSLPPNPRCVGVITSAHGAAWHDIQKVAFRRSSVRLILAPAVVQGESAPASLLRALALIERHPDVEVLIIGRGGGAAEDLMAFNDERLVRRIAKCAFPVVSAVGHETDVSLTDWVADARAATPSEAAELVVADQGQRLVELATRTKQVVRAMAQRVREDRGVAQSLALKLSDPRFLISQKQQDLDEMASRLQNALRRQLRPERSKHGSLHQRLLLRHPKAVLAAEQKSLAGLRLRLGASVRRHLQSQRSLHVVRDSRLNALSPVAILSRGYAVALATDGRALRSAGGLKQNETVRIMLADGEFSSVVKSIKHRSNRDPIQKEESDK